ncbi:MAG: hypothetical protein ACRDKV_07120 [Solirubrobacterales bacterium]
MKRDEALMQLSRDHHQALHRAMLLKRADESSASEALRAMIEFFDAHAALREAPAPRVEDLHELGERLDGHVRHEERVLFPAIEEALSDEQLASLGRAVEAAESGV